MHGSVYDTTAWQRTRERVLARDGNRCSIARLIGGDCHPRLDCHHLVPVAEGGAAFEDANVITACASHHPMLEAFRRRFVSAFVAPPPKPRCRHQHRYPGAREECERRLARRAAAL